MTHFRAVPIQSEEKLFIDAIRDLNYQASRVQAEESSFLGADGPGGQCGDPPAHDSISVGTKLFPHQQSDSEYEQETSFVDAAADAATEAFLSQRQCAASSPDLFAAISWMQAIRSGPCIEPAERGQQRVRSPIVGTGIAELKDPDSVMKKRKVADLDDL